MVDLENRMNVLLFDLLAVSDVDIGDGDQEGFFQDLGGGREMGRLKPYHGDAAALAVAAVAHLPERVVQVPTGDGNLTGQANDSATAFSGIFVIHLDFR